MAITYNWDISQLDCYTEKQGKERVVYNVCWRYQATEDNYFAEVYGSQHLNSDDITDFVSYSDLTKEKVVEWVKAAMGPTKVAAFKSQIDAAIENQKNPPVVTPPLPWK